MPSNLTRRGFLGLFGALAGAAAGLKAAAIPRRWKAQGDDRVRDGYLGGTAAAFRRLDPSEVAKKGGKVTEAHGKPSTWRFTHYYGSATGDAYTPLAAGDRVRFFDCPCCAPFGFEGIVTTLSVVHRDIGIEGVTVVGRRI